MTELELKAELKSLRKRIDELKADPYQQALLKDMRKGITNPEEVAKLEKREGKKSKSGTLDLIR